METTIAATTKKARSASMESLVARLSDANPEVRMKARWALTQEGAAAIPLLHSLLSSTHAHSRWEAVKTLGQIHHPGAIDALASALNDDDRDVRWTAAQALIEFGSQAFQPVLEVLVGHAHSVSVRESAAHILSSLRDEVDFEVVAPVLSALHGSAPLFETPMAAYTALHLIQDKQRR
jgi:HEAT repeat protein